MPRFRLLACLLLAAPALAEDVVRLSPEAREQTLETAARGELPINGAPGVGDGKVHGEMFTTIGSNGYRALGGSAVVPLGRNAMLGLSVVTEQGGRGRAR